MKKFENYLGISGLMLIWYNSQDDNELVYDGIHMDYVDIQSAVYERYCEECGVDSYSDDAYDSWLKSNLDYIVDEMLLMGDWLFDNKTVGHGRFHSYLEPWKYKQMLGKTKEKGGSSVTIFIGYGTNEIPVGNLELGNNVRVSDPCYSPDTWCSNIVCGFKPGTYHAYVQKEDEENHVAELIVYHEDYDTDEKKSGMFWRDYCIDVAVDSGQAGFFDETYYVTAKAQEEKVSAGMPETGFYRDCCNITLADDPYGILNNQKGVVSESGYGDGCYTMYAAKDSDGYIISAKIVFIYSEDEKEDDDDDAAV